MSKKQLTLEKREILARLLQREISQYQIASILGLSPSAITQDLKGIDLFVGVIAQK